MYIKLTKIFLKCIVSTFRNVHSCIVYVNAFKILELIANWGYVRVV